MHHETTWKGKLALLLKLAWPIAVTQVSLIGMNLVDTIMTGRVGTNDLAGVAIGSGLWTPIFTGVGGVLMAVSPIVAQQIGAGRTGLIGRTVNQAIYVAVALALLVIGCGAVALGPLLAAMGVDPAVESIAFHYLVGLAVGIVPLFAANVLRYFFDAHGHTHLTMFIMLSAIPMNVLLNYGLIFGHFGLPALGGVGAGYATGITYWLVLALSVAVTFRFKAIRGYAALAQWTVPSWKEWRALLTVGLPIGLSIFFETGIFSVVTLMMGMMFTTETVAAHQVALNFTSLIFMVPLSMAMALTIVVGYSVGAAREAAARQYALLGVLGCVAFLAVSAAGLYVLRVPIARMYSPDPDVVGLAASFLTIAIVYQLSDAAQVSLQGVLRGYKDVRVPFVIALVAYWVIGFPAGYALAAYTAWGPRGFWIGITIGLTFAAIGFLIRLRRVQRGSLSKRTPASAR
ncbi:MATE family efflux transporter [Paenibacillus sp. IB182496]|uniref:Probable multidrug resistance protein NorM n=1 Tax=Paenibacillus sabuli TaxID=2772509 RepID=A0A927BT20_9BACL|nr:MATE family efflux transporter [Paenibacillus sabuli]MBD2845376.1 MATE family efflux transporter [Paenibacillus sabuli]